MELFPSALAVGFATLFALAGPQQEPPLAAEIEALIEKTNALSSFHLRFQGSIGKEGDEGDEETMEVVYRGPWSARVTLETAYGVTGEYLDDRRITFTVATDESEVWHSVELPDSEIRTTLDELFPTGEPLGPGAVFDLLHGSSFSLNFELSGRSAMFAWLPRMLLDLEHVTREAGELVWSTGELELRIARATGLPQALLVTEEGLESELRLQEDRADVEIDELLAPPEDAEPASEDEMHAFLVSFLNRPDTLRRESFARVEAQLRAKTRAWDARTRAGWEAFMAALHTKRIEWRWHEWLEQLRAEYDEHVEWARGSLEEADTPERRAFLVQYFAEDEETLRKGFAAAAETYSAELPKPDVDDVPRDELFEVEREVIERLHEELVSAPFLARFHEQVEALLGKGESR